MRDSIRRAVPLLVAFWAGVAWLSAIGADSRPAVVLTGEWTTDMVHMYGAHLTLTESGKTLGGVIKYSSCRPVLPYTTNTWTVAGKRLSDDLVVLTFDEGGGLSTTLKYLVREGCLVALEPDIDPRENRNVWKCDRFFRQNAVPTNGWEVSPQRHIEVHPPSACSGILKVLGQVANGQKPDKTLRIKLSTAAGTNVSEKIDFWYEEVCGMSMIEKDGEIERSISFEHMADACRTLLEGGYSNLVSAAKSSPERRWTDTIPDIPIKPLAGHRTIEVELGGERVLCGGACTWGGFADQRDNDRFVCLYLKLKAMALEAAKPEHAADTRPQSDSAATRVLECLTIGAASGELPTNFVVTLETHGYPARASGMTGEVFEAWSFTPDSICQLNIKKQVLTTKRFAGIRDVCRELVRADFAELAAAPHGKPTRNMVLLGTPCAGGRESVTVTVDGKTLSVAGRCCWAGGFADDKHQQRFADLYEALRAMAPSPTVAISHAIEAGAAGDPVPTNFAVRIMTHAVGRSIGGFEGWRFTPGSVATLGRTNDAVGWTVASVATNFSGIGTVCRVLQEADFAGMASRGWVNGRGGKGPFFSGTPSIGGERIIAVCLGTNELTLGRSCWRGTKVDENASEKRMADLYETLKVMAPCPAVAISNAIEAGAAGDVAPAGLSVSIEAFGVKERAGKRIADGDLVSESWRFTGTNVFTYSCNAVVKTRAWTGMRDVCRALATAGFMELATAPRQDGGEETWVLGGEKCREGWQCIRVRCDDQSLTIGEGLTWKVYTDPALTERMHGLYQTLRKMALNE